MKLHEPSLFMCGQADEAAGLPPGTIAAKILDAVVDAWTGGDPGALTRWIESHFVFTGDGAEKAAVHCALSTGGALAGGGGDKLGLVSQRGGKLIPHEAQELNRFTRR